MLAQGNDKFEKMLIIDKDHGDMMRLGYNSKLMPYLPLKDLKMPLWEPSGRLKHLHIPPTWVMRKWIPKDLIKGQRSTSNQNISFKGKDPMSQSRA